MKVCGELGGAEQPGFMPLAAREGVDMGRIAELQYMAIEHLREMTR